MAINYGRRWHMLPPELQLEARKEFISSCFTLCLRYPPSESARNYAAARMTLLQRLFGATYLIMSEKWSRKTLLEDNIRDEDEVDEFLFKFYHQDYYNSLKK